MTPLRKFLQLSAAFYDFTQNYQTIGILWPQTTALDAINTRMRNHFCNYGTSFVVGSPKVENHWRQWFPPKTDSPWLPAVANKDCLIDEKFILSKMPIKSHVFCGCYLWQKHRPLDSFLGVPFFSNSEFRSFLVSLSSKTQPQLCLFQGPISVRYLLNHRLFVKAFHCIVAIVYSLVLSMFLKCFCFFEKGLKSSGFHLVIKSPVRCPAEKSVILAL